MLFKDVIFVFILFSGFTGYFYVGTPWWQEIIDGKRGFKNTVFKMSEVHVRKRNLFKAEQSKQYEINVLL